MTEGKEQRIIMTGHYMISDGLSFKQALIRVGYAEQTARCPKANGLSAKRCAELALKEDKQSLKSGYILSFRRICAVIFFIIYNNLIKFVS